MLSASWIQKLETNYAMNFWLDLFTGTTWEEFRQAGSTSTVGVSFYKRKLLTSGGFFAECPACVLDTLRRGRTEAEKPVIDHCVSRVADRRFAFRKEDKEQLRIS